MIAMVFHRLVTNAAVELFQHQHQLYSAYPSVFASNNLSIHVDWLFKSIPLLDEWATTYERKWKYSINCYLYSCGLVIIINALVRWIEQHMKESGLLTIINMYIKPRKSKIRKCIKLLQKMIISCMRYCWDREETTNDTNHNCKWYPGETSSQETVDMEETSFHARANARDGILIWFRFSHINMISRIGFVCHDSHDVIRIKQFSLERNDNQY